MNREQEIFTAGFIAGLARAAHLSDPRRFPAAPNMTDATRLFEEAGGLAAFMTLQGVKKLEVEAILALQSPPAKVEGYILPESTKTHAAELRALIDKATDDNLSDGGRYFSDSCDDLTRCRHEEIGEYQHAADGELIEWLWNNRRAIAVALEPPRP